MWLDRQNLLTYYYRPGHTCCARKIKLATLVAQERLN